MSTTAQTVQSYYQNMLLRTGSDSEVNYWTNLISSGTLTASQVENDFVQSAEAQTYVVPIIEAYQLFLGRVPDAAGLTYWVHLAESGTAISTIDADFANSPEAAGIYGDAVTTTSLTTLYHNAFDRAPDAAGLQYWLNSGLTISQIEVAFMNSPEATGDLPAVADNYLSAIGYGTTVSGSLYATTTGPGSGVGGITAPCFASGTHIATPDGETAVEDLQLGDKVLTQNGASRTISWIGRRHISLSRHPSPEKVQPIRVRWSAFSENVPSRDLYLSPDHAVFLDDVLVPIRLLVNGASIAQETSPPAVVYYHVELDTHDILLAEGLAAESYLDTGNRGMFENSSTIVMMHPEFGHDQARREAESCAPLATSPDRIEPLWRRLACRAEMLGWSLPVPTETTEDPDLKLVAESRVIKPLYRKGRNVVFVLPRGVRSVRLLSRSVVPSVLRPWIEDSRRLGVMISSLTIRIGTEIEVIPLDHPMLSDGWWSVERDEHRMWRWTNGEATVPLTSEGHTIFEVQIADTLAYPMESVSAASPQNGVTAAA